MPWTDIPSFNPGAVLTSDQMNDLRVNANIGHTICTSTTRPGSPESGQMIYETDTRRTLVWNGSAWTYTSTLLVTSSTRPASPPAGTTIFETDTALLYVWSGSAWVKVLQQKSTTTTGWTNATYQNSWVTYNAAVFAPARYIKDDLGVVHLDGLVMLGTIGAAIFTLPAGHRPAYTQLFAVATNPNTIGRVDVLTNGQVVATSGNNGWISLAGLTFLAEA